jgi:hypothetical protein
MLRFLVVCSLVASASAVRADPPKVDPGRKAVDRGLDFLRKDAAKWKEERTCSTCHHGVMTVWALAEAKARGYDVPAAELADAAKWTTDRLDKIDQPRDTRPGYSMVSTPALYLAAMAAALPKQEAISAADLKRIAGHLRRHQESDGSWSWASAPAANRPPPVFESDEVATLWGLLALGPKEEPEVREKAVAWLAKATPTDTTQAAALRLWLRVRQGESPKEEVQQFLKRQHKDGGWGQLDRAPSDAYATGQALYVLSLAGVPNDAPEVKRAVAFLTSTQKDDGSWPMARRSHPGITPSGFVVPITYFGSAWATLGLLRSVPR